MLAPHAEIVFASPKGGRAPLDAKSVEAFKDDAQSQQFLNDAAAKKLYENTVKLSEVKMESFHAIFYVGGHGPVVDLAIDLDNIDLASGTTCFHSLTDFTEMMTMIAFFTAGKPVAAVCHGPAALANVKDEMGKSIFDSRKATGFSNDEEDQAGMTDAMPFLLEDNIKVNGGTFQKADKPWAACVTQDNDGRRILLTGQNPASAKPLAEALLEVLQKMQKA